MVFPSVPTPTSSPGGSCGAPKRPWSYVLAVVAAGVTLALRLSAESWFGDRTVLILFILPIAFSAYLGGVGPGLVCTAAVGLGVIFFVLPPLQSFAVDRPGDVGQWLLLLLAGVVVSLLSPERAAPSTVADTDDRKITSTERKVRTGFAAAFACLGLVGVVSYLTVADLRQDAARVIHTREVIDSLERIAASVMEAQNGHRGYVLTWDESYLEPHRKATQALPAETARLRGLVADNPGQARRGDALARLLAAEADLDAAIISARRNGGGEQARALLLTGDGPRLHARIEAAVAEMKHTEETLLAERERKASRGAAAAQAVITGGGVLGLGVVVVALLVIRRDFSGRREAERALRRSEENLAITLNCIGDAVLATDLNGKITRLNRAAENLTGWTEAEAVGRPAVEVFRVIDETTRQPLPRRTLDVLAKGRSEETAAHPVLLARDGTERAIAETAAPIRDRTGHPLGVVLVFRDITPDRVAEAARQRHTAEIHDLYNQAPCGYHSLDASGVFTAINDTELKWLGYTRVEVIGRMRFTDLLNAEGRATFSENFPRFLAQGWISNLEFRITRKDGTTFPGLLNATAIRDADGRYVTSRSTLFDLSLRKQAEEERDRFFTLSLDFLCISSADGYFKRVSPAVTDILGWSVDEFLARPYLDWIHPDDHPATLREVEKQIRSGEKVLNFENRYRHRDGGWRTLSWRSVPQPDGLMYAIARDVTQRREAEAQIQELNRELARRAAALEAANQELEAFSYSVSHDLRAPLRHVNGYVSLLVREAEGQLPPKAARFLGVIADAGREMSQLIDDLLAFSRMGRTELRETVVEPDQFVGSVRNELELATRERAIVWTITPLPAVRGDPTMLRQVFANLIGNAVKYTRQRETAEIAIGCCGTEGDRHVFFVRDNGAGFDMRYAEKLFGVFQRLHRADEFEGTGIGLASVRRILNRHGCRIWAEAAPNAGATFFFTLPAATPATSSPALSQ